jgi:hypothetical protein
MCMRDARAGAAASVCLIRGCREREDTLVFRTPRLRCLACTATYGMRVFFWGGVGGGGGGSVPAVATRARPRLLAAGDATNNGRCRS